MTKKELEEREIKLEAIVDAYHKLIEHFTREFPVQLGQVSRLENYSMALFNAAEVRVGIEDLVDFGIVYE